MVTGDQLPNLSSACWGSVPPCPVLPCLSHSCLHTSLANKVVDGLQFLLSIFSWGRQYFIGSVLNQYNGPLWLSTCTFSKWLRILDDAIIHLRRTEEQPEFHSIWSVFLCQLEQCIIAFENPPSDIRLPMFKTKQLSNPKSVYMKRVFFFVPPTCLMELFSSVPQCCIRQGWTKQI